MVESPRVDLIFSGGRADHQQDAADLRQQGQEINRSIAKSSPDGRSRSRESVYLDIAKRYYGSNNGQIPYSIGCAVTELQIGAATAKRALDELQDRGFIVVMKKCAFSLKQRHASVWRLTEYSCDVTHALSTKDFMRWTPDKNKTRYPQRNQPVAVVERDGSCSGMREDLNTSHGSCSGTVSGILAA
jgi:hypothetical protein